MNVSKILILQKKAIRTVTHSGYLDHSDPLFYRTNTLKVNDIYDYLCCCLAFKRRRSLSKFSHSHNTRSRSNYFVPTFQRLGIAQRSLFYALPNKFNQVPDEIKSIQSFKLFKGNLRRELVKKYSM